MTAVFEEKSLETVVSWHCTECEGEVRAVYNGRLQAVCHDCGHAKPWGDVMTHRELLVANNHEVRTGQIKALLKKYAGGDVGSLCEETVSAMLNAADRECILNDVREWLMLNSEEIPVGGVIALIEWRPELQAA